MADEIQNPPDLELVELARKGDMAAYEILVGRYQTRVYALAYNIVHNEADARDVAQDAFVKAWKSLSNFQSRSAFYTWIYRITTNLGIDLIRKRRNQPAVPEEVLGFDPEEAAGSVIEPVDHTHPSDGMSRRELRRQIDLALEKLTPEHRTVIVLREFDCLDYQEIADVLECSVGTVMSRLFYARRNLKKYLKEVMSHEKA